MSRITKDQANFMASDIVDAALKSDKQALKSRAGEIWSRAISELWSPFPKLPTSVIAAKGLFPSMTYLDTRCHGKYIRIHGGPSNVPHGAYHGNNDRFSSELQADIVAYAFEEGQLKKRRDDEIKVVTATILAFGTWKRIAAEWPEIATVVERHSPPEKEARALVSVEALNKRLGLPTPSLVAA